MVNILADNIAGWSMDEEKEEMEKEEEKEKEELTWSSRGNSLKTGMYFAHSTRKRSCCFMDSQTVAMEAICLLFKS